VKRGTSKKERGEGEEREKGEREEIQ